jgi:hypothetical protein|nr:MAG TPA: hypothetical protein [Caudoviricetes sp.]
MTIQIATIIFFICSLINVMLSTLKTILTVKASKGVATIINAITYGFYAIVVKQLASLDLITTVTVTIITNIIGVYVSMWLLEKTKKDCLWKISVTTKDNTLVEKLEKFSISYIMNPVQYKKQTYYNIDVFSENQKDSSIIENILKEYKVKYNITEINKKF